MKAKVRYTVSTTTEIIDLENYGYDEDTEWSDLSEEEQIEIMDSLRENSFTYIEVENYLDF